MKYFTQFIQLIIQEEDYLFIFILLDTYLILLSWGQRATMPRKEKGRREGADGKTILPTQVIDVRMGEEEKNRKQKEEQKKETGSGPPTQLPGPFGRLLRPAWIIR